MAVSSRDAKIAFIKRISSALVGRALSGKTQLLIITHAAMESGWGISHAASRNNFWNLTAGRSWTGETFPGPDTEYDEQGAVKKITQSWRAYANEADAASDYLHFLCYPRYLPARAALLAGDPLSFVQLLGPDGAKQKPQVGGFYTLPTIEYQKSFNAVLAEVARLGVT